METALRLAGGLILFMHGLSHLMGTSAYWQLAKIQALPYKTSLLDGRWEVGQRGIQLFGAGWLLAMLGFMVTAYGLVTHQAWTLSALAVITLGSLLLTALDYQVAYAGVGVNLVILLGLGLSRLL